MPPRLLPDDRVLGDGAVVCGVVRTRFVRVDEADGVVGTRVLGVVVVLGRLMPRSCEPETALEPTDLVVSGVAVAAPEFERSTRPPITGCVRRVDAFPLRVVPVVFVRVLTPPMFASEPFASWLRRVVAAVPVVLVLAGCDSTVRVDVRDGTVLDRPS